MVSCWKENPDERPSFKELSSKLERFLQSNANYLDLSPNIVNNGSYLEPIATSKEEPATKDMVT